MMAYGELLAEARTLWAAASEHERYVATVLSQELIDLERVMALDLDIPAAELDTLPSHNEEWSYYPTGALRVMRVLAVWR